MSTAGKLELTIKINTFPEDVKAVENGWKQFEIDTGEQFVTVTVKPKVFKKLEQAQDNWPMWVAAIAEARTFDFMSKTARGSSLDFPSTLRS